MIRTLSEVLSRALADVGEARRVVLSSDLRALLGDASPSAANGGAPDVALVLARAITARGEVDATPLPEAREVWAILPCDAESGGFVDALPAGATGRVTRIYHPLAIAEVREPGLVIVEVVRGKSARDVARVFGVPCFAGPDLAEWRAAGADEAT